MKVFTNLVTAALLLMSTGFLQAQCAIEGYDYGGLYNGHHYYVSDGNATWVQANANAVALGGYLATIADGAENAFVAGIAWTYAAGPAEGNPGAWIGFNDIATEGTFVWANGEPVTYTNWLGGEPNDAHYVGYPGEDWVEINFGGLGRWNDLPEFVNYIEYVVEFNSTDEDCDGTLDYCDSDFSDGDCDGVGDGCDAVFNDEDCDGTGDDCDDSFEDADCDGVGDGCDNCAGGDDSGPCDATSFPGFSNIPADWVCHANERKVFICHEGETLCVDYNAVQAHLDHGDFLGPCSSCGIDQRSSSVKDLALVNLEIFPNPASESVTISLSGLGDETATVKIFDKFGRLITERYNQTSGELKLSLDQISAGELIVRVTTKDQGPDEEINCVEIIRARLIP